MIGEILDAKYRIDKQLGAGGMGNVYLATHLGTTRMVAVKVIAPKWAAEPQFLARFQREAQACGRLRHPNIVNITDFGIANTARGDLPYLVMEFLDGQTLSDFQRANPGMPLPLVADLLDQIGLALAEAHRSWDHPSRSEARQHLAGIERPRGIYGESARLRSGQGEFARRLGSRCE